MMKPWNGSFSIKQRLSNGEVFVMSHFEHVGLDDYRKSLSLVKKISQHSNIHAYLEMETFTKPQHTSKFLSVLKNISNFFKLWRP